jgi:hypothetical protein
MPNNNPLPDLTAQEWSDRIHDILNRVGRHDDNLPRKQAKEAADAMDRKVIKVVAGP